LKFTLLLPAVRYNKILPVHDFKSYLSFIIAAIPQHLVGFTMDSSLPTDQEFLLLSVEGLNAVIKDVGGEGGFLHVQTEWNCHAQVLDYGDLTYRPLLSPFDVVLTMALYHEGRVSKRQASVNFLSVKSEPDGNGPSISQSVFNVICVMACC